ncbi:Mut7-C ubiquitin/RNAse domain-containing protein [Microbulbifer sediminum]|uniref:Mut7-C ubiquitin/RNAse domain-containing protein n=1 Tax=Microbulbifer sediminum TaxID=2904250 RepID=UPI001F3E5FFC|nr:Mut7-C ubiquitin/RNAse domain-containing protein [Microbulbifer sediminum]
MARILFQFYGNLNDFLSARRREQYIRLDREHPGSVKDAIESLGVPHVEVDRIWVDGRPQDFDYQLQDGDRVHVYPRSADGLGLMPPPQNTPVFVLDCHLGRLARYLRLLGFDSLFEGNYQDRQLLQLSVEQDRTLLTRDRDLLKRKDLRRGYYVRATRPRQQLQEVSTRFGLARKLRPFSRCTVCNGQLSPVAGQAVAAQLQPRTRRYYREFLQCHDCGRVYWKGSHFQRLRRLVDEVRHGGRPAQRP